MFIDFVDMFQYMSSPNINGWKTSIVNFKSKQNKIKTVIMTITLSQNNNSFNTLYLNDQNWVADYKLTFTSKCSTASLNPCLNRM